MASGRYPAPERPKEPRTRAILQRQAQNPTRRGVTSLLCLSDLVPGRGCGTRGAAHLESTVGNTGLPTPGEGCRGLGSGPGLRFLLTPLQGHAQNVSWTKSSAMVWSPLCTQLWEACGQRQGPRVGGAERRPTLGRQLTQCWRNCVQSSTKFPDSLLRTTMWAAPAKDP